MTRLDVRQYLEKIYDLPVRDVTTYVEQGEITWSNRADTQYRRALWKKDDRKYAIVVMVSIKNEPHFTSHHTILGAKCKFYIS
jgi:hypothetical protein